MQRSLEAGRLAQAAVELELENARQERYYGWDGGFGRRIMNDMSMEEIAQTVDAQSINPAPRSGRQEYLENLVNRYL